MEEKKESKEGKNKLGDYVRWIFVGVFSLIFAITIIMAIYRKFLE